MAQHILINSPDDVPAHHDHKPVPIVIDSAQGHDVTGQGKHLTSFTGEKGASNLQSLLDEKVKNGERDQEAHFSTNPKPLRSHIDAAKER